MDNRGDTYRVTNLNPFTVEKVGNIGGPPGEAPEDVLIYSAQTLNTSQRAQVRENLGMSAGSVAASNTGIVTGGQVHAAITAAIGQVLQGSY